MEGVSSVRSFFSYLSDYDESLLECCICRSSMSDPVMLSCLHSCCRSCTELGRSAQQTLNCSSSAIKCPLCGDATEHSSVMSNSLLYNYKRLSTLSLEVAYCSTCDVHGVAAIFWCADCCMALCESCYSWHNRFHRRHRIAELEVARTWSLSQLTPAAQCSMHKRHMEVQCFTCRAPKCQLCYESCRARKHDLQSLSHGKTRTHISAKIVAIKQRMEQLHRVLSGLQHKCRDVTNRLHGHRMKDGSRMLLKHKRSLLDATRKAFDTSVGQVCMNLERIWVICTTVMGRRTAFYETVMLATGNIKILSVECLAGLRLLRANQLVKRNVIRCMSELGVSLRDRRTYWLVNLAFSIDGSLPLTSDIVLRYCLGATDHRRAAPPAPLHFGQVSVTFRTPVDCADLAVTRDGHVLLAAAEHGLLVYSDRGQQLSSWRPERLSNGEDDGVMCVASLCDGVAAVGVYYAQIVVLLKLSQTGDTWLQDRRAVVLQSPPFRLAVHGDLLAAVFKRDEQQLRWAPLRELKLLKLSSGQVLYTQSRDYDIFSVALTALCVVTTSRGPVERSSGAKPHVLDAFSHSGEFLWRHETNDEEAMQGLCVSADTWRRVYVSVARRVGSSRVMAIGGADGRDSREVLSSRTHGLLLPAWLSLARGQQRTVMAVMSWDRTADQYRAMSLYEATS